MTSRPPGTQFEARQVPEHTASLHHRRSERLFAGKAMDMVCGSVDAEGTAKRV
eukprot:CAMPEP_0179158914 /NCGR_PEP_ID=MMETSP0796-20121207/77570_1 /TAXON_ID=73915 /ORGANISM="Pyrodinium bahamense, Strain pbaha01" /LENGTH=52 /DNA_ID=CAMNT_0020860629 /DNA_START=24 /DNA_END=178 /DNA_ORIENTATION=-